MEETSTKPSLMETIRSVMKKVGQFLIIIIAFVTGMFTLHIFNLIHDRPIETPASMPQTQTIDNVDVALDQNSNLLMISRDDGTFVVYSDSVGMTIFKMYANVLYSANQIQK